MSPVRAVRVATVLMASLAASGAAAHAQPAWTTYHRDNARSGYDSEAGEPIAPSFEWQSPALDGETWGQPLVLGERVYIATAADSIYALEASTGKVVWQKSAGEPVPAEALPCGDIKPTVGIVGTPVIDASADTIYAVADVWDAGTNEARHLLKGYRLSDGAELLSTPVDPPGANPKDLLQRTALTLDSKEVLFGFGGNDGDCGEYRGAVAIAPEEGGPPRFWQYQPKAPAFSGGAVWASSGPVVGTNGDIYFASGNPNVLTGEEVSEFDYSDSFLRLDPTTDLVSDPSTEPAPLGWFEPPTWKADSNNDRDLGSAGPELLPGELLFQAGKNGTGYLIEADMTGAGRAVYEGQVCGGAKSFGGDAFAAGVIYVACQNGVQALSYDQSARTFASLWQGPADAFGPPIVAAGTVWTVATRAFEGGGGRELYGLDPTTGQPRYTETLPTGVSDHFASPSAADGRLFIATGASVSAYRIAQPEPSGVALAGSETQGSPGGTGSLGQTNTKGSISSSRPATALSTNAVLTRRHLRAGTGGMLRIALRCPAKASCAGTITLRARIPLTGGVTGKRLHGKVRRRTVWVTLARVRYGPSTGKFEVVVRLDRAARAHLRLHHDRLSLQVRIATHGGVVRRTMALLT